MLSQSMKLPGLVRVAIVAALCLIGFVAKATLAQDPAKEPGPLLPRETASTAPSLPQDLDVPKVESASQLRDSPVVLPAPGEPAIIEPAGMGPEDPEKAALAFVEQNQKQAESQLQNLKAEEAKLQARLRKVEAGIKRWDALLGALKQSKGSVAAAIPGNADGWKKAAPPDDDHSPRHGAPAVPKR